MVELESAFTMHGPCSWRSPIIEDEPGPPFIHIDNGALDGSLLDSKNQKNVDIEKFWLISLTVPGGRVT